MGFHAWKAREGRNGYASEIRSLSSTELLAHVLRSERAATALLNSFGTLAAIAEAELPDLVRVPGVGVNRAEQLLAAFALADRARAPAVGERRVIASPRDAFGLLRGEYRGMRKEAFKVLLLNARNQVLTVETVSVGSLSASLVHPREVFRPAIQACAASIVLAHNHPSGDPEPSDDDLALTRRLVEVGVLVGIEVLDHVIVAGDAFVSLKDRGVLR